MTNRGKLLHTCKLHSRWDHYGYMTTVKAGEEKNRCHPDVCVVFLLLKGFAAGGRAASLRHTDFCSSFTELLVILKTLQQQYNNNNKKKNTCHAISCYVATLGRRALANQTVEQFLMVNQQQVATRRHSRTLSAARAQLIKLGNPKEHI